jgi:L,D-peptidoglycan transpeptidase YkuD (ErfK/YbiS/YcfS/YnhG family)
MRHGFIGGIFFLCCFSFEVSNAATRELNRSRQCMVVLTDHWNSTAGELRAFERVEAKHPWREHDAKIPVVLGKKGLGRGRGFVTLNFPDAPEKREGDDRAPAGLFKLPSAFGYAPAGSAKWIKLPYLPLTEQIEGIDDPDSHYYTRVIDRSKVLKVDWKSSERMRRSDVRYKWGIVVQHNPSATPGAGSCIFIHVWKNGASTTIGCTAMAERDLVRLLQWLDPMKEPILVQLPRADYRALRARYGLPDDS